MNKLLEKAFAEAARLPDEDQEALAKRMLADIEDECGWNERFAKSPEKLARLAERARERITAGETLPYDPSDHPGI